LTLKGIFGIALFDVSVIMVAIAESDILKSVKNETTNVLD
jgi:hypothetical protein